MRTALAGTAPTALPGVVPGFAEPGGWFSLPAAVPPPPPTEAQPEARRDNGGGLDSWLLDKLFGRR
jgi:hypothetical protein